jgi:hypothetical protein
MKRKIYAKLVECLIREKVVTFRMVKLNMFFILSQECYQALCHCPMVWL